MKTQALGQAGQQRPLERLSKLYYAFRQDARFARDALQYLASKATSNAQVRMLLVSDRAAYTSEVQLDPFFDHRSELANELGLVFRHKRLPSVLPRLKESIAGFDIIGLKLGFRTDPHKALEIVQRFSSLRGDAKLVYFDGDDDSTVQWPKLLPLVDLYIKKHMFRDHSEYSRTFIGRNNLTEYVARNYGASFEDDMMPASEPVDPRYLDRIVLGWNIGLDKKIVSTYHRPRDIWNQQDRPNDIVLRSQLAEWLIHLRGNIEPLLANDLPPQYKFIAPTERVTQEQYDKEMHSSKICIAPFGFGELCWRDFEAVLWGCLMMKPDMSHIRTEPDIFVPGETYVPLKWDLSDLVEKCVYYLEHDDERRRITENAYRALEHYYESRQFVQVVGGILEGLGFETAPALATQEARS
jgi:hypothetical protein